MQEREQSPEQAGRPAATPEDLQRWEDHGATWRVLELGEEFAVVELCTCYGEPVDVLRGEGRELVEYVRAHRDSG
jgi:hypothetical protein